MVAFEKYYTPNEQMQSAIPPEENPFLHSSELSYDSGGGVFGHLSHEVPTQFGVESSNAFSSQLAVDE